MMTPADQVLSQLMTDVGLGAMVPTILDPYGGAGAVLGGAGPTPTPGGNSPQGQSPTSLPTTPTSGPMPRFNHLNAGWQFARGMTIDGLGQLWNGVMQRPIESLGLAAAATAVGVLGGPPAWLLMGLGSAVLGGLNVMGAMGQAKAKADEARALAAQFRFEEAQQRFTESEKMYSRAGTGVLSTGLGLLGMKQALVTNASKVGASLQSGWRQVTELPKALFRRGYWQDAPQGNLFTGLFQRLKTRGTEVGQQFARGLKREPKPIITPPPAETTVSTAGDVLETTTLPVKSAAPKMSGVGPGPAVVSSALLSLVPPRFRPGDTPQRPQDIAKVGGAFDAQSGLQTNEYGADPRILNDPQGFINQGIQPGL